VNEFDIGTPIKLKISYRYGDCRKQQQKFSGDEDFPLRVPMTLDKVDSLVLRSATPGYLSLKAVHFVEFSPRCVFNAP